MKKSELFLLILFIVMMGLFLGGLDLQLKGGCGLADRLLYPFCHVNVWHCLANLWCVYIIVKSNFRTPAWMWLLAYLVAIVAPATDAPTMGLSGIVYAIMGMMSWQTMDKKRYHIVTLLTMAVGLLWWDRINNWLHIYSYGMGVLIGWIYAKGNCRYIKRKR